MATTITTTTTSTTDTLQEHKIIGDILAPGTKIPYNLKIKWPSETLWKPGQAIHRDATQPCPEPENPGKAGTFVLLMVDPDLTRRHDTTFGQVRHWLAVRASVDSFGRVKDLDDTISPYVGPAPMPVPHLPGNSHPSRYTFILCHHKDSAPNPALHIDPDSLRDEFEGQPGELGKASQDIIDRMRFNTQKFIERNGLEVVGATFMFVEGNLKSGVANLGLTAQGIADKIIGK